MYQLIKQAAKNLSAAEKRFVLAVAFIVLIITLVTTVFAYFTAGENYYTGQTFIGAADKLVYLSQIEESSQGGIITHNLYTSEPQLGYFSPLWLVLGKFSKITTLSSLFTFHFFRIIFGFIFLYLLYLFISQIFTSVTWRKIAFLVLTFSSGLGVLTVFRPWTAENFEKYFGADLWFSEGNTFLTIYHSPLFILSQICLLLIFWWTVARLPHASIKEAAGVGLLGFALVLLHPYDLVIIGFVLVTWLLLVAIKEKHWSWPISFRLLIFLAVASLAAGYFFILKSLDPTFAGWAVQNVTLSPRIFNYMVGFGIVFILFAVGVYPAIKSNNRYLNFLVVWAVSSWFLLYSPLQSQRKSGDGMHIPMALLAALGLMLIVEKIKSRKIKIYPICLQIVAAIMALFLILTNLLIIGADLFYMIRQFTYITKPEQAAMSWLKVNLNPSEVILSDRIIGNIIPAFTGRYVYIGHGHQTIDWIDKKIKVENWFFKSNSDDKKKSSWLKQQGIDYVYFSRRERRLGDFNPGEKNYLELMYQNADVKIFKVKDAQPT